MLALVTTTDIYPKISRCFQMGTSVIYMIMMTVVGFVIFDSHGIAIAFGIGLGNLFGTVFSSSKEK